MPNSKLLLILVLFYLVINYANTLTVTTTADDGIGSLRCAMTNAGDGDSIAFNIPGAETRVIELFSPLPDITQASLTIDATTQPGYNVDTGIPVVEVNGRDLGPVAVGFNVLASNVTIVGLSIVKFGGAGINVYSSRV